MQCAGPAALCHQVIWWAFGVALFWIQHVTSGNPSHNLPTSAHVACQKREVSTEHNVWMPVQTPNKSRNMSLILRYGCGFYMFFSFKSCFIMFFSHNCKRKTVAETLPPLSRGPQGEVEGRGGRHQGSWVKRAETWVNWAASNPTKLVTEGIVASFNESFKWFNACFLGLKNRGTIPALLGELYRHFLTLLNWYWGLSLFPVIARES